MRALLLLLMLASPVVAQEHSWELVQEYTSPAEDLTAFVKDAGKILSQHTHETGHEVCGMLAQSETEFGVVLGTSHSQIGCLIYKSKIPQGFVSLNQTIHSHPTQGEKILTDVDRQWLQYTTSSSRQRFYVSGQPSRADRQSGPGWLIAQRDVYYFEGLKVVRRGVISAE